jgi:photosystem II stability/assembly factor-like uncharacterized protein
MITGTSERKSRRFWKSAVILLLPIVALALVAGCGSQTTGQGQHPTATVPAATPTHPAGPVVTAPIDTITMFSATEGWGRVLHATSGTYDHQVAYTVDGGHTWYDVTPTALATETIRPIIVDPLSSTEAWTWTTFYGGTPGESTTLWHTTDTGAHWSSSTVATGAVTQVVFIDATHGWLAATPYGSAMGQTPIVVWSTTDGGATWTQVASTPVMGHTTGISFVNTTTGFATASGPSSVRLISVTHDAGVTWTPVALPAPTALPISPEMGMMASPPVFTSATSGVMEVTYYVSPLPAKLYVYRTADTGSTWQLGPGLGELGMTLQTSGACSVLYSGEMFAAVTTNGQVSGLAELAPAATSWTIINTDSGSVPLLSGMTQLDFVNLTAGLAVTHAGLIATTNGGETWAVVHA